MNIILGSMFTLSYLDKFRLSRNVLISKEADFQRAKKTAGLKGANKSFYLWHL